MYKWYVQYNQWIIRSDRQTRTTIQILIHGLPKNADEVIAECVAKRIVKNEKIDISVGINRFQRLGWPRKNTDKTWPIIVTFARHNAK